MATCPQKSSGKFPNIHPFWGAQPSLRYSFQIGAFAQIFLPPDHILSHFSVFGGAQKKEAWTGRRIFCLNIYPHISPLLVGSWHFKGCHRQKYIESCQKKPDWFISTFLSQNAIDKLFLKSNSPYDYAVQCALI